MKEIKSVEITEHKVKLVVIERDYWGRIVKRQQMTFRRRHFETMLARATAVVPWSSVKP